MDYFTAIAEHGNLTDAAASVGVSKQALSKFLSELTEELGVQLFEKHRNLFILTEAGRVYLKSVRRILFLLQQTREAISQLNELSSIKVGVTRGEGYETISQIMNRYTRMYPEIFVNLENNFSNVLIEKVIRGEINFCFASTFGIDYPEIEVIPLTQVEVMIGVGPSHELYHDETEYNRLPVMDLDDLRQYPFCFPDPSVKLPYQISSTYFQGNYPSELVRNIDSSNKLRDYVLAGVGLGFLPYSETDENRGIRYIRLTKPEYLYHSLFKKKEVVFGKAEQDFFDLYREAWLRR